MIRVFLSESIFNENGHAEEIAFNIDEEDLLVIIKIAKNNKLDFAILNTDEK